MLLRAFPNIEALFYAGREDYALVEGADSRHLEALCDKSLGELKVRFEKAMDADLNTSLAITALYDVLKAKTNDATKLAALADFDRVLSLDLLAHGQKQRQADREAQEEGDPEIDALVRQRTEAKKAKNWAEADRIRDELKARCITITDTPQGTKWSR